MPDKAWKRHERVTAGRLGAKRSGPTGTEHGDVTASWLVAECKERKALPRWIERALCQAASAASARQLPVAVLHQLGRHHDNDLVVMRLRDFQDWFAGKGEGLSPITEMASDATAGAEAKAGEVMPVG